jgi:hypothetical protein
MKRPGLADDNITGLDGNGSSSGYTFGPTGPARTDVIPEQTQIGPLA